MNTQAKQIIESRFYNFNQLWKNLKFSPKKGMEKSDVIRLLYEFIEHPTKPGYKRKDIEYFIKLIENG